MRIIANPPYLYQKSYGDANSSMHGAARPRGASRIIEPSGERVFTTMRRLSVLVLFLALLAVTTCAAAPAPVQSVPSVPFATIAAGAQTGIRQPGQFVIRSRAAWQSLWRRHSGTNLAPHVDFNRDMVIAVFAGEFTEPATIAITRIIREPSRLVVQYSVSPTRPPLDGPGIPPVAPFHIVRMVHSSLPVVFSRIKTPPVLTPQP